MQRGPVSASDIIPSANRTSGASNVPTNAYSNKNNTTTYSSMSQPAATQQQFQNQQQQQPTIFEAAECLDAFFPFDPCHLVICRRLLKNIYTEWQGEEEDGDGVESDIDLLSSSLDIMMSSSLDG
jgi:hypothetical protein